MSTVLSLFLQPKSISHDIIDEQIEIMAKYVLQGLLVKILAANYFAMIGMKLEM